MKWRQVGQSWRDGKRGRVNETEKEREKEVWAKYKARHLPSAGSGEMKIGSSSSLESSIGLTVARIDPV